MFHVKHPRLSSWRPLTDLIEGVDRRSCRHGSFAGLTPCASIPADATGVMAVD